MSSPEEALNRMTTSGRRKTRGSMTSRLWTWKPRHIPLAVVREPAEFRPDTVGVETPDVVTTLDRAVRQKLDDVTKMSHYRKVSSGEPQCLHGSRKARESSWRCIPAVGDVCVYGMVTVKHRPTFFPQ
jgi:hypothetical protein